MLTAPPSGALDLLVVGGLTIDRLPDGRDEPGGSVLHVARAAAPRGLQVGIVTAAGPEPAARQGVEEMRAGATYLHVAPVERTITFRHGGTGYRRRLWLECGGAALPDVAVVAAAATARAVLYAPVAGELAVPDLALHGVNPADAPVRGAILQGWLRTLDEGEEVRPRALADLGEDLARALGGLDLLIASREDLAAEGNAPRRMIGVLRERVGPRPALVVTDGAAGAWALPSTAASGGVQHLAAPRRVEGVPSVGAGDVLGAFLLAGTTSGEPLEASLARAMRTVVEVLEMRRRRS